MIKNINNSFCRRIVCLGLAAAVSSASCISAFADEPAAVPGDGYEAYLARLQDNHMEYDELFDLVKNYYGPIKSGYAAIDDIKGNTEDIAVQSRVMADDMADQERDLKDAMKEMPVVPDEVKAALAQLQGGIKELKKGATKVERSVDNFGSRYKSVDRQTNGLVQTLESLMNQYEQLTAQRPLVAKSVELAQKARDMQVSMQAQGLAVDAGVLSAAAQLSTAQDQLASMDSGIEQLRKTLCKFTGWDVNTGAPEIGPVPHADVAAIASIDVNGDKEKAVNNNYTLISLRGQAGGGMDLVESQTTKTTTQTRNKLRTVEYNENTVRSNIQTLYDTILEKKVQYDSASTAWQSAQLSWNAAQIQRQSGAVSDLQFTQMELAYLQAQSGYHCADLALQQAMKNYEWAVKGVDVRAE